MPARKKKSRIVKRKPWLFLIIPLSLIAYFLSFVFFGPHLWDGKSSLSLAINTPKGDVLLAVFDPARDTITTILLPKDTQVNVSRQLGIWRLGSVWKLAENENLDGRLLAETISKSFKLPIEAWAGKGALGFSKGDIPSLLKSLFLLYQTNLKFRDKLGLTFFSIRVRSSNKIQLNPLRLGYLFETKLSDARLGYKIRGDMGPEISAVFTDSQVSQEDLTIAIVDASGQRGIAGQFGKIIEVLGAKVVSLQVVDKEDLDCEVIGLKSKTASKIANIFSCQYIKKLPENNFDIQVNLGKQFAERF